MPRIPAEPEATPHGAVMLWLGAIALMIALTAGVGAATRLTGSGLSITEWAPIMGVVPPLSDGQWQAAFDKYREIPQYKLVNKGMSLDAFKTIFWWEWGHRVLARSIGLVVAVPMLALWWLGRLPRVLVRWLIGIVALGALQGVVGWYMVRSGLVDRVDVSQYRLALHLGIAVAIFGLVIWKLLQLAPDQGDAFLTTVTPGQRKTAAALVGLIYLQILLGALVAGLKAGRTYNTWPLMDGTLVPEGLLKLRPLWLNALENVATVQFNHRLQAYLLAGVTLVHTWRLLGAADDGRVRASAVVLVMAVVAQSGLGIWTLLAWVPISLGVAHQLGAFALITIALWHLRNVRRASPG